VKVKQVAIPQSEETYSCAARRDVKERESHPETFSSRMEDALKRLAKTIGGPAERSQQEGAAPGRHSGAAFFRENMYEVTLVTHRGRAPVLAVKEDREQWRKLREGSYMLRTNLKADTAEQLWSQYMQLTEAEAAFRA